MNEELTPIERYLAGDGGAFATVLHDFGPLLYGVARLLVRDPHSAEEVVQLTSIKLWTKRHTFISGQNFKAWMLAVLRHTAVDYLRKKSPTPVAAFEYEDESGGIVSPLDTLADQTPAIDTILDTQYSAAALMASIGELPERYRTVLLLVYQEDLTLTEVAEALDKPYNTIKSLHRRGIELLRETVASSAPVGTPTS